MKKTNLVLLSLTVAIFFFFGLTGPGMAIAKQQTNCPVMGGPIDKSVHVDYKGKRVYFCCSGCIDTFKKDPAKYIKKMESQGIDLEETTEKKQGSNDEHAGHNH